tara:strand:+ start:2584 stop:3372 length:789 start_codon:yes stop_codon:yes gene_type:complete
MGLLEKASNIEGEDKTPETKVVKPKTKSKKEPPVEKTKKPAKKARKVKPKKEKKPRAPRVRKELPDGFEAATTGQKITRRIFDFAVSYGWTLPLIGISAWGSNFNPTIIVILGIGLISFNLGFMPTYAGKRTVGNWVSRTQYINSRGEQPLSIYLAIKGMTTIFVLFGVFTVLLVMANGSLGKSTISQIFSAIGLLCLIPPIIDYIMYRMRGDLGLWDTIFGGVWLVRTTKSKQAKGWLKRLESVSDWTESKGFLDEQESTD